VAAYKYTTSWKTAKYVVFAMSPDAVMLSSNDRQEQMMFIDFLVSFVAVSFGLCFLQVFKNLS
jgi:hypothetical protein